MAPAVVGRTVASSTPSFEPLPKPPDGAPNVVVIVLDDLGFAQLGCYGGRCETPAIDRLAAEGLRYRSFHVTALCSPTRACVLTGRNHHSVGMGFLTDIPIGFPGYDGRIPKSAATLPRVLRDEGYSTFAVGKWHLAPRWEQSASGPFTRWPIGQGFERYYGFLNGDTNQWAPELVADNTFVEPPRTPAEGYHLTEDLADHAIRLIQDQHQATPNKPFFLYFAPGAVHAPHQAPAEWIERYAGRFDDGWESLREETFARQLEMGVVPAGTELPERPDWIPEWASMSASRRAVSARLMEAFAGFLSHADHQIGRLLDQLEADGLADDTIVVLLSDNGASGEGGPVGSFNEHRFTHDLVDDPDELAAKVDEVGGHRAYNHYPWGWAWAGNTPFKLWKRYTWLGGVRTPLIIRWPNGIATDGEVRSQFCHAVDVAPTILDAIGIDWPEVVDGVAQQRVDGASLRDTFEDGAAPAPRETQYFEMLGSRAIYHDGWKATTDHVGRQLKVETEHVPGSSDFDRDHWALYDLNADASESFDRSADHPDRLADMIERWEAEAAANQVLPLDDGFLTRAIAMEPSPWGLRPRATFHVGGGPVNEDVLPPMGGGFRIIAEVSLDAGDNDGIVCALGDWSNGWALFVDDGRPTFVVNRFGELTVVRSSSTPAEGARTLTVEYERVADGGGPLRLSVDGERVGEDVIAGDLPFRWQIGGGGLLVGRDAGFPVCGEYEPPFASAGEIHGVTIESTPLLPGRAQASDEEFLAALHRE